MMLISSRFYLLSERRKGVKKFCYELVLSAKLLPTLRIAPNYDLSQEYCKRLKLKFSKIRRSLHPFFFIFYVKTFECITPAKYENGITNL